MDGNRAIMEKLINVLWSIVDSVTTIVIRFIESFIYRKRLIALSGRRPIVIHKGIFSPTLASSWFFRSWFLYSPRSHDLVFVIKRRGRMPITLSTRQIKTRMILSTTTCCVIFWKKIFELPEKLFRVLAMSTGDATSRNSCIHRERCTMLTSWSESDYL